MTTAAASTMREFDPLPEGRPGRRAFWIGAGLVLALSIFATLALQAYLGAAVQAQAAVNSVLQRQLAVTDKTLTEAKRLKEITAEGLDRLRVIDLMQQRQAEDARLLHYLARETPPAIQLGQIARNGNTRLLREGQSLSAALAQLPELLPPATAELIQTAERQGKLAATLDQIADDYARQAQGRSALRAAIGWPIVLAIGIGLLVSLLMIFVIPTFKDLFQSFGADLPLLTLGLVWVSDAFANFWWLLLLVAILLFVAWWRDLLPLQALRKTEQLWLSIPFVRPYFVRRFATRMARWLRLCRDDQALLLASLRHVRGTERFDCFRACAAELEARLAEGKSLGAALAHNAPLPQRLALFVQLGEKLGDSAPALDQVIAMSERETADALSQFERGLTISSYLALGLLVGIIVIAIYLPIFKMGSVI